MRFGLTIFVAAFLVFQVQPIVGKAVLPWFGGGAAVWTICLLFFQCQLLAGYAYAHVIATRLSRRAQRRLHLVVVGLALALMAGQLVAGHSPILPSSAWQPRDPDHPVGRLLVLLACTIGLPYLALAATGPLIQSWFSRARPATPPYRLYALSNAGSLLALVSYPFVIEPNLTLHVQALAWSIGFVVFAIGTAVCARAPEVAPIASTSSSRPGKSAWLVWLVAPACASVMLLATTNQLCQAVAPMPFLWVLPLAIYLLSFVLCFQSDRIYQRGIFGPLLVVGLAAAAYVADDGTLSPQRSIVVYGLALFAVCMTCHGELARARPTSRWLTAYYLTSSAGGALGGVFVGLVAPLIFDGYWELFVALILAAVLAITIAWRDKRSWLRTGPAWPAYVVAATALVFAAFVRGDPWLRALTDWPDPSIVWIAAKLALVIALAIASRRAWWRPSRPRVAMGCLAFAVACLGLVVVRDIHLIDADATIHRRGFYGVLSIAEVDTGEETERAMLYHGPIIHGAQYHLAAWRTRPTTYYVDRSGIGRAILGHPDRAHRPLRIGVVGLGTGTLAAFARAGDTMRFYDIDPDVVALSRGPHPIFTYLADSPASIDVVLGDARLSIEREAPQHFDVLVIDAFAGDAIPVHLLTREAIAADLGQLGDDGLLAVHISNWYLDLEPVLASHATTFGLAVAVVDLAEDDLTWGSTWVVLARDRELLGRAGLVDDTRQLRGDPVPWTDDSSNLLRILR